MAVYNGDIIKAPVSVSDVKEMLGVTTNDLATLCTDAGINMWAKYKPVSLNKMWVPDTLNSDKMSWTPAANSLGWWIGNQGRDNAALVIPLVTSKKDFDNGNGKWVYNKPIGGKNSPYRLSDFAGYWDGAVAPIYSSYPYTDSFYASETAIFTIHTQAKDDVEHPNLCVSLEDVFKIITQTSDGEVYPAIYIYNVTKKMGSYYSKEDPIAVDSDNEDYQFRVNFGSGSPISDGGVGFKCDVDDTIRVYLLLCTQGGVEESYFFNSFSLQHDQNSTPYKEYTLKKDSDKPYVYNTVTVTLSNKTTKVVSDYAGRYVLDGDGNVLKLSGLLEVGGNFKYTYNSSFAPTGMRYCVFAEYEDTTGNHFTTASEQGYVSAPSYISTYNFNNLGVTLYQTKEDAENQENGARVEGIPLISENATDGTSVVATNIGLFVSFDAHIGDSLITAYTVNYNGNPLYSDGSFSAKKVIDLGDLTD